MIQFPFASSGKHFNLPKRRLSGARFRIAKRWKRYDHMSSGDLPGFSKG